MFISEKHRKDVCIRRICGATISNILPKLLKGIFYQVLMAICIATPIAILFSQKYLSVFPNHFSPGIKLFLEGGFLALMITMLTVSWQAWRAASRNPVESLRYE
jgi:putative ABC transport system permease protein